MKKVLVTNIYKVILSVFITLIFSNVILQIPLIYVARQLNKFVVMEIWLLVEKLNSERFFYSIKLPRVTKNRQGAL